MGIFALFIVVSACSEKKGPEQPDLPGALGQALQVIGKTEADLSVPRLDGLSVTPQGRRTLVDTAMRQPLTLIPLSRQLAASEPNGSREQYIARLFAMLGLQDAPAAGARPSASLFSQDERDIAVFQLADQLVSALVAAQAGWEQAQGKVTDAQWAAIGTDLADGVSSKATDPAVHRLSLDEYHRLGNTTDVDALARQLVHLVSVVENAIPGLRAIGDEHLPLERDTPVGRLRIAGTGPDRHEGSYALLIDLGGDDIYADVGPELAPGTASIVIDLDGNDTVTWRRNPGPGAGIMGMSVWMDLAGNDTYRGTNLGLGVGMFGAGLFLDAQGDDIYEGGSRVQGAGQYGIGLMLDGDGNDRYDALLNSQGYGGSGGYGILVDLQGDDSYACNPWVPDQVEERNKRHGGTRYLSLCQGYGFGRRQQVSGGVGLLLDREGNDGYKADLFAQGGAYWFGLGMLVDGAGDDSFEAFEHCQGAALHLGAGFLGDWDGNDEYIGYEHCQGVGIDRAAGLLYDHQGNDRYLSHRESQGAGLKPFGVGLLIEMAGDDHYQATETSQGYSARPPEPFPEHQWPLSIVLDTQGNDSFVQPNVPPPTAEGRVQNRQGIATDH